MVGCGTGGRDPSPKGGQAFTLADGHAAGLVHGVILARPDPPHGTLWGVLLLHYKEPGLSYIGTL